jgi:hypothetical protein
MLHIDADAWCTIIECQVTKSTDRINSRIPGGRWIWLTSASARLTERRASTIALCPRIDRGGMINRRQKP